MTFNKYGVHDDENQHSDNDEDEYTKPRGITIMDVIANAVRGNSNAKHNRKGNKVRFSQGDDMTSKAMGDIMRLASGMHDSTQRGGASDGLNMCATTANEEHDMISIMVGSGASGTVASSDHFADYPLIQATAFSTTYTSAAANAAEEITNVGEKYLQVADYNGIESMAKFQKCRGLGRDMVLASVSRLIQIGHSVVFQAPEYGSYIVNNKNGCRSCHRQQNGPYYLGVWVERNNKAHNNTTPWGQPFMGQDM